MTQCDDMHFEKLTVAKHGREYAAVRIVPCEDEQFRYGVDLHYSHGGFSFPIRGDGFASLEQAKAAGIETLLRNMHKPFPSDPDSVKEELRQITQQLQDQLKQPAFL
jgi:hypothetical protein